MSLLSALSGLVSTAGHFEFMLDHCKTHAYVKSIDGGHVKSNVIDEPIGHGGQRIKHTAVADIEPITVECGLAGAWDLIAWIESCWNRDIQRKSGEIIHANFDMCPTYICEFTNALITEAIFPALDGNSKEPGYLKVKFQPEGVKEQKLPGIGPKIGNPLSSPMGTKQKEWSLSQFRLLIDGIPEMVFVNHIDSFTVKQGIKKMWTGVDRFPHIEPTKLEFPHLSGTLASGYSTALNKWHEETNHKGAQDPSAQKTGSLEFLGPDRLAPLMRIELHEVGLFSLNIQQSTANADAIKRTKFDLYVGRMSIDPKFKFTGHDIA